MHFVKFHPEVASCLLSRGKRMYVPPGDEAIMKINYFLVYHLILHILVYLQNYKEFEAEILDLQLEIYGLSFDIKKCTTSGWALGDENVIGIRSFNFLQNKSVMYSRKFIAVCWDDTMVIYMHKSTLLGSDHFLIFLIRIFKCGANFTK